VLFFSGLSFAAWIARRLLGPTRGVVVAGLLGGVISSTSVTLTFARASRSSASGLALALGTVGACTVMLVRVAATSAVLNPALSLAFLPFASASFVVGLLVLTIALTRTSTREGRQPEETGSPLQLGVALQMAALFQIVLLVIGAVVAWWGMRALLVTSAAIGLTDLDALTLSLARNSNLDPSVAARGLAAGVLSNTLLKMTVAIAVGRGSYRFIVGGVLGTMAACVAATLWWFSG